MRSTRPLVALALALVALVLVGAGCGGEASEPAPASVPAEPGVSAPTPAEPAPAEPAPTAPTPVEPAMPDGHAHGDLVEAPDPLAVSLEVAPDAVGGYNVRIATEGFTWAPEHASGEPVPGEGHAHLYVDGEKVARVYTEWFHLPSLEPGPREVSVELNGNDHSPYAVAGEPVQAVVTVEAGEPPAAHGHDETVEAPGQMAVALEVTPDAVGGYNVRIATEGFTWAPEHASGEPVPGEGHAHLYVDGEKVARVYGGWFHLAQLEGGRGEVRVTLNGNDHVQYAVAGEPVEAVVAVGPADAEPPPAPAETPAEPGKGEGRPEVAEIVVEGGAPVGGVKRIEATKGDKVSFRVVSDLAADVHVHGYELEKEVGPGAPATFSFTADLDGIYEIEIHAGTDVEIAKLVVEP